MMRHLLRGDRTPALGRHYESVISLITDPDGRVSVRKVYRQDAPSVRWLNQHLSRWYPSAAAMPIAQHETAALQLLSPFGIAPKPLSLAADAIVMAYAGEPISRRNAPESSDYAAQCRRILEVLSSAGLRHNDMLPRNVLVHDGRVRLIDFTLAEFGDVKIMAALPVAAWARPGFDGDLSTFHEAAPDVEPTAFEHLLAKAAKILRVTE